MRQQQVVPPSQRSGPPDASETIHTPDRRVRVFVSSTLQELADEREAARTAINRLRLTPVMFELGARPHPPRELYRAYLAQSDVFVGIYWQRYGWVAPGESVSGLEDEYRLSGDRPKLIYVRSPAPDREPGLGELLARIRDDDRAAYKPFTRAADLEDLLADDLAVLLTERFAAARASPPGLRPPRLPAPPTPMVGRAADAAALRALLLRPDVRLVTVVGPGGIGKTRLALDVAATLPAGRFGGAWFVDLAPVTDPALVPATVATALGVHAEGTRSVLDVLAARLAGRRVLLVLDNFEHVLPASPVIARLLGAAPGLTALVTTRTVLRLRGEHEFPLAPLPTPRAGERAALEEVAASDAVQLFVTRAEEVRPGFALSPQNADAVAEVARRLDGIPLAIELAAARVRLLPPAALLRRLGDRLDLQAGQVDRPERQRTLRTTIDWSHSLLGADERAMFARLSVFTAGWSLEAAEAVGAADGDLDALETLSSLVAQSLVAIDERHEVEPRFRMLDTVRQYALERLRERGEEGAAMRRLAGYLRAFSFRAGEGLGGPENRQWVPRIDAEVDNLLRVLRWAIDADEAEMAIRIAAPLSTYWWTRSLLARMVALADETAALPSAQELPPDAVALMLWARGTGRIALGRVREAVPLLRSLAEAARALGSDWLRAHALCGLALTLPYKEHAAETRAMLDEAAETFRRIDDSWGVAYSLILLGQRTLRDGDPAGAAAMHHESLEKAELIDNDYLRAQALDQLGLDTLVSGDVDGARARFAAAADVHRRLLDQEGLAYCLDGFAGVALAQGRLEGAARLIGAAAHIREVVGVAVWPLLRPLADALVAAVREPLGEEAFRREAAVGAELQATDALAFALEATAPRPAA